MATGSAAEPEVRRASRPVTQTSTSAASATGSLAAQSVSPNRAKLAPIAQ
jgi:hypothetical protein